MARKNCAQLPLLRLCSIKLCTWIAQALNVMTLHGQLGPVERLETAPHGCLGPDWCIVEKSIQQIALSTRAKKSPQRGGAVETTPLQKRSAVDCNSCPACELDGNWLHRCRKTSCCSSQIHSTMAQTCTITWRSKFGVVDHRRAAGCHLNSIRPLPHMQLQASSSDCINYATRENAHNIRACVYKT